MNQFLACPLLLLAPCLSAQSVLFDFDNAPPYTPLPINVTAQGVTAHLSATGAGYSIQSTSAVPVVPLGFTGNIVYPSSIFAADLLISFTRTLTAFSIQYSPQELGCDDSARMRVTAFRGSVQVSAFGPLPLDASTLGMPGCTGYASIDAVNFLNGSGGAAVFSLNVPQSLALVGMRVWQQALVPDPAAGNPLQAVLSDAAAVLIGQ